MAQLNHGHNTSLLAGWLFADLLLVLAVIGLGSVTFRPIQDHVPLQSNLSCEPFLFPFALAELEDRAAFSRRFDSIVSDTLISRGISNGKPGIALLFGGYDPDESVVAGQRRAQAIEIPLRKSSQRLRDVAIRKLGARNVDNLPVGGRNQFGLLIYFVYNGADSLGRCSPANVAGLPLNRSR